MKKLVVTFLFFLIFVIFLIPNIVFADDNQIILPDYSWYGDGTKTNYEISSVEQLLAFANIVNGKAENIKKDTFKDKKVSLTRSLDLTGIVWTPIGSSMYDHSPNNADTKMFEGTFDGNFYSINGLSSLNYSALAEDVSSGEHSYGLFGYVYGANLKNLSLTNVAISCSGEAGADGAGVASVIGYYVPKNNKSSIIENIHVLSGSVRATNNMGGIIGLMEVKGENINIDITIKNCTNSAKVITDAREAGGILGLFQNADGDYGNLNFINCENYGEVIANNGASSTAAGGILGKEQSYSSNAYNFKVNFENCRNSGKVTAIGASGPDSETHAAGIGTAYYANGAPITVNHCVNVGDITITGSSEVNFIDGIIAHPAIGNINKIDAYLQNASYNLGNITSSPSSVVIVKYDVNESIGNELAVRVNSGSEVELPIGSNLSRDGYIFTGWNTKIDGTGINYLGGTSVKVDGALNFYAQWRKSKDNWSVLSIPVQVYTGKPIKPSVLVYDGDNNIIDSSKYVVTYEKDSECINVGNHIVKITYNNEIIELDYEIIKSKPEINITPSLDIKKDDNEIVLVVTGVQSENIRLICDDASVIIKDSGNNTFTATLPNKDKEYQFTVIYEESDNHFGGVVTTTVSGIQIDEIENPKTNDNIFVLFIFLVISVLAFLMLAPVKKYIE